MIHPVAWAGWLASALVALSATRNPLHLTLILLCVAVVNVLIGSSDEASFAPVSPLRFGGIVIALSALFNAATVHLGDTVLLRLPSGLPILGGPITLEALAFGVINGLVLTGIFAAFTTFNQALPIRSLMRLIPRAFYPVAVVVSIAVTFVPTTLRQFQQIREAQAVRGHRVRGLRGWLPLFMPLLVGGLERALQLAEAMTARGFASVGSENPDTTSRSTSLTTSRSTSLTTSRSTSLTTGPSTSLTTGPSTSLTTGRSTSLTTGRSTSLTTGRSISLTAGRLIIVIGLLALLGGWLLRLAWGHETLGQGLMLAGGGLILGALWAIGRRVPRTTYRHEPWRARDWGVVLSAAVVLAAFVRATLFYSPYPALALPSFSPAAGVATLGLLGPAFLTRPDEEST